MNPFRRKEKKHLLHTIAHEIGYVMIGEGHANEEYPANAVFLKWSGNGGRDPYVSSRLMCSGNITTAHTPGCCLIKKEWDRIEDWLHANVDPNLN